MWVLKMDVPKRVTRLREALSPAAIYLFGPYAYGTPNRQDDIDLLVVVEDSPLSVYQRDAKAYPARLEADLKQTQEKYRRAETELWRELGVP